MMASILFKEEVGSPVQNEVMHNPILCICVWTSRKSEALNTGDVDNFKSDLVYAIWKIPTDGKHSWETEPNTH